MKKITGAGWVVGVITWLLIMWYATTQSACLMTDSCKGDDMFMFAVIGLGMLAPSWLAASVTSVMSSKD